MWFMPLIKMLPLSNCQAVVLKIFDYCLYFFKQTQNTLFDWAKENYSLILGSDWMTHVINGVRFDWSSRNTWHHIDRRLVRNVTLHVASDWWMMSSVMARLMFIRELSRATETWQEESDVWGVAGWAKDLLSWWSQHVMHKYALVFVCVKNEWISHVEVKHRWWKT